MATALEYDYFDLREMNTPILPSIALCGILSATGAIATQASGMVILPADVPITFTVNATESSLNALEDLAPQPLLPADLQRWAPRMMGGDTSHMLDI